MYQALISFSVTQSGPPPSNLRHFSLSLLGVWRMLPQSVHPRTLNPLPLKNKPDVTPSILQLPIPTAKKQSNRLESVILIRYLAKYYITPPPLSPLSPHSIVFPPNHSSFSCDLPFPLILLHNLVRGPPAAPSIQRSGIQMLSQRNQRTKSGSTAINRDAM